MFKDRRDAGEKLGQALQSYKAKAALVLAIPRGGVEVGYYVARHVQGELGVVVCRKLPYPDNPEAGFGAVAEDGSVFIQKDALGFLSREEVDRILQEQKAEIARRVAVFRGGEALPVITGRDVILVDDGIAMGSTMRAAAMVCKNKKAKKIIVASPVAGPGIAEAFAGIADEVVVLEQPPFFRAVAQVYENWYDVPEAEVLGFIRRARRERKETRDIDREK